MATTARQILAGKRPFLAVDPGSPVFEALQRMADANVGWALVTEGSRLVGIFTERDYARKVVLQNRNSKDTPVRDVMTTGVVAISPDWTAEQCMALMDEKRIRHLPVVEHDRVLGVVSIRDTVHAIVADHQFTIRELEHYIKGGM